MSHRNHPTVSLTNPRHGYTVDVDEDLAELVAALWSLGIETAQCCQEWKPGYAWVAFLDVEDLRDFMAVVADESDEDTWGRLATHTIASPDSTPEEPGHWRYRLLPQPADDDEPWFLAASVEFPIRDIPVVTARAVARSRAA
jgi:hypothetical protein